MTHTYLSLVYPSHCTHFIKIKTFYHEETVPFSPKENKENPHFQDQRASR